MDISREHALETLKKYNKSEALIRHGIAVEGAMRQFAKKFSEDEQYWAAVGLLHDIDYEMYPEEHCHKAGELLKENGYDDAFIRAVVCHGYGLVIDVEPILKMEKVLYTIDELTGLIAASALMRPSKSIMDMEVKSAKKKFKTPSFAAGVNREVILNGCNMLDMTLDEVIAEVIEGMKGVAEQIGL